jgi:predicted DNA-binding transcriptional regulator YafY
VDPYCVRVHGGELYLLGLCHLRGETRVFLADRIRDCEPLEEDFRLPPGFDLQALFRSTLGIYLGNPGHAVVRFEGTAARYIEQRPLHPEQEAIEQADGHLVIRVPIRGYEEITHEVLRFGSRAEVLNPPELRGHFRREVERMAGRYAGEPGEGRKGDE